MNCSLGLVIPRRSLFTKLLTPVLVEATETAPKGSVRVSQATNETFV
jgi:hypothetical protein